MPSIQDWQRREAVAQCIAAYNSRCRPADRIESAESVDHQLQIDALTEVGGARRSLDRLSGRVTELSESGVSWKEIATALLLNVVVAAVLTVLFGIARVPAGTDATEPEDYYSDQANPDVLATEQAVAAGRPSAAPGAG